MPEAANDNRVSPWAWFYASIAGVLDAAKFLLFFLNGFVGAGTAIDVVGSFIISVIEITVVFGGLWFIGLYKGKRSTENALVTMAVSSMDLMPIIDDIPFTTPTVLFMIMRAKRANDIAPGAANDAAADEKPPKAA